MKGMLLAAGLGTRLRPLTNTTPKAMLSVADHPLLAYGLGLLQRAGIRDVMINLHYHGEQIQDYCGDGSQWGLHISYSEEPKIMGSGGALKKCEDYFGDAPFVAINADTLMDIDLKKVISAFDPDHAGLMVTCPVEPEDAYGRVGTDSNGKLTEFGIGHHTFAGIQIVTKQLMRLLPPGESSVMQQGYIPLMAQGGVVDTYLHTGYWNDVGTPERYDQTCSDFATGYAQLQPVSFLL